MVGWRRNSAVLERLREAIAGIIVTDAEDRLVLEAKEVLRIGELRAKSRGALGRKRRGILTRLAIGDRGTRRQRQAAADRRTG